jgi:hypothetical protein
VKISEVVDIESKIAVRRGFGLPESAAMERDSLQI